ncbi:Afadin and alpha-actinin-binding-domain-containing protein [Rhodocollybia butyracea]|uniref:Afadin and alpha-actinin-binding-domain-containing protein n=1 Tax=Rhodocollybia butyracea TaxID=206335 RepID=A0A9P5UAI9_9AGAR|nr:Afadin and alpha-actinin-binding-domain-containing protein [Rhodocollybia butyracea]
MAAMATPAHKAVHWNSDSDVGSPSSQFSDDSIVSTSSLQYVNSQLITHGFASTPGISLEGLSKGDMDRTVKCLLGLLAQRVKDMTRTEQLTTELRTLRYDHERMISMHRTASDSAANFEREVNLQKSRLAATTKSLQANEAAHKQTSAELQRTRSALQAVRATHLAELKKKEKEVERMVEKWNKISDSQAKLCATASGLQFNGSANAHAVTPAIQVFGKGRGYLEIALEEAEKAREQLVKENLGLRKMVLKAVNEVQNVVFELNEARGEAPSSNVIAAPTPMTLLDLFPLSPPDFTTTTLSSTLTRLRDTLKTLSSPSPSTSSSVPSQTSVNQNELDKLQRIIERLESELLRSQEVAFQATESRTVSDRFAAAQDDCPSVHHPNGRSEISKDLITARDEERERLDVLRQELEEERRKYTETAIQLGNERVSLEAERTRIKEEKRSWQAKIAELYAGYRTIPLCKGIASEGLSSKIAFALQRFQISVGKGSGTKKTTRISTAKRRSSSLAISQEAEPAFETEVIPPSIMVAAPVPPVMSTTSNTGSLLPTSFVLPPPSPCASLPPPKPALLLSDASILAVPATTNPTPSMSSASPLDLATGSPFPYPVAKPFAPRMIHAYSPVKPSPLSRILMLGNSPGSPTAFNDTLSSRALEALMEIDEFVNDSDSGINGRDNLLETALFPANSKPVSRPDDEEEEQTLAQQLGIPDSPPESSRPESPLREKKLRNNISQRPGVRSKSLALNPTTKTRVAANKPFSGSSNSKSRSSSTVDKSKAKSMGPPPSAKIAKARLGTGQRQTSTLVGGIEKENFTRPSVKASDKEIPEPALNELKSETAFGRGVGGPRRVPLDSAEAPPAAIARRRKL